MNLMNKTAIIEHPYLIYKEYTDMMRQISSNLITTLPVLTTAEGKTISILEAQYNTEHKKEAIFIQQVEKYLVDHQLTHLYTSGRFSQMITLFDAYRKGIIQNCNTLQEALKQINQFYGNFSYKSAKEFIIKFFTVHNEEFINQNIHTVFDTLEESVKQEYQDPRIAVIMERAIKELKNSYFTSSKHLSDNYIFQKQDLIRPNSKIDEPKKTILEELRSKLHGTFGGIPGEVAVGGGMTGTQLKGGKNPDTDTIQVLDSTLSFTLPDKEQLLSAQATYEEMREIEKTLTDCYVIHNSIKAGSGSTIKIKDEASYLKRIDDIKSMFQELHITSGEDFLFTLANTIPDMAAENRWEDIRISLIQLTTLYMFDDILPSLNQEIQTETYNTKKLNFYNIGGRIITASELFKLLLEMVNDTISKRRATPIVSISRKVANVDYNDTIKNITNEQAKWDAVYTANMTANKISMIRLNSKNIIRALIEP